MSYEASLESPKKLGISIKMKSLFVHSGLPQVSTMILIYIYILLRINRSTPQHCDQGLEP